MRPSCPNCKVALGRDRIKGRHIDSLQGYLEYERTRYRCHECGGYYFPADYELGVSQRRMSIQKEKQLALLSVHMPYEEAKKVYKELTGLAVGRMTAHRTVQRLGAQINGFEVSAEKEGQENDSAKRHVTADGVMIHLREEGWKEAKVGSVYKVNGEREAEGQRYTATVEDRASFGRKLYELAGEPQASETAEMAFIGDAARWLDELQGLAFPLAERIVDFWHVTEYLWEVANTFYQEGTTKAKQWAQEKVRKLREGQAKLIQASLSQMKPRTKKQREVLTAAQTYFGNHAHQMDYPRYEAMGLHIGSGIAEAACKFVIQTRFKRCGMRWSRQGAENLLRLRLAYVNRQWDEALETAKN